MQTVNIASELKKQTVTSYSFITSLLLNTQSAYAVYTTVNADMYIQAYCLVHWQGKSPASIIQLAYSYNYTGTG